jgi:hypothetical protein
MNLLKVSQKVFLSEEAKDWGWVSINDVLPSDFPKSKMDPDSKVTYQEKAMPTYILSNKTSEKKIEEIVFYDSYDGENKIPYKKVESQIPYYVFAKRGGRYLLSKKATVNIKTMGDAIELEMGGWINKDYVQIIKDRVCWEPCWNQSSYKFYNDKEFYVYKEDKRENAVTFRRKGINNKDHILSRKYEISNTRKNIKGRRSFQVEALRAGVVKVLVKGDANEEYSTEYLEKQEKDLDDIKENIRTLNLLFLIDGTSSMKPYLNITSNAIKNAVQKIGEVGGTKNSVVKEINFAVGIYRDHKNTKTPKFEFKDFTPKSRVSEITNFIENVECESSGDKDIAEDLYFGLNESMKKFGNRVNQKNVVIVIGDAGDHQTTEAEKIKHKSLENNILKLASEYNVSWGFYQVNRKKGRQEYRHFPKNAKRLIAKSADNINKNNGSKKRLLPTHKNNHYKGIYSTTLDLDYNLRDTVDIEDYMMFGYLLQPKDGAKISDDVLSSAITNSILKMQISTKKMISILDGDHNSVPYRKILIGIYKKTPEEIDLMVKYGLRIPGYLPVNTIEGEDINEDAMCKVIMMTPYEFRAQKNLLLELSKASSLGSASEVRANLIDVLTEKLVQVTGNSGSKDLENIKQDMQDYLLNDAWKSLFGKEFTYDTEKGEKFSIADMSRSTNFSDSWIRAFSENLSDRYDNMKNQIASRYPFKEKTGVSTNNESDYLLYVPYDSFFP